jgi:hypothetical protein
MDWVLSFLPDISLDLANKFYTFGWAFSVLGALITLIALIFLMGGTRVRDRDFEHNIATLHDRAATSEERSRTLEQSNLNLQGSVERERTERLRLEATIAPRTLNAQQVTAVTVAFRRFAGRRVLVRSYSMDAEGALLGQQIIRCLEDAGLIVVNGLTTFTPIGSLSLGVHVTATPDQVLAQGLASALGGNSSLVTRYNPQEPAGGAAMILGGSDEPRPEATILVGPKPIPNR